MNHRQQVALERALALSRLDPPVHVLPCWRRGKSKGPTTPQGFYNASSDEAAIRELWATRPGTEVGIWPGASGLIIEDIDLDLAREVNGYNVLERADVVWESPVHYGTPSGGEHHVWPANGHLVGPAAPIRDFAGVDRRSGDSLCLWYGPVPSQEQWSAMMAQPTPDWLLGPAVGRSRSRRAKQVESADFEEVMEWIESLTQGEIVEKFAGPTEHYGELLSTMTQLVELSRTFPTWPGLRPTFDALAASYIESPVATTPEPDRPNKVIGIVRWALGATADTEDMTLAYNLFAHPDEREKQPVPDVPAAIDEPNRTASQGSSEPAGTSRSELQGGVR